MKLNKTIQTSLIIIILLTGVYYLLEESLTKYYYHSHCHELKINISRIQNMGIGQATGFDVVFSFENKKTGAYASFNDANDRFWYEIFVEDITIEKQKRKTIVIHDLSYGPYFFIDYKTLKERGNPLFEFDGRMILDSTDIILQELKHARPIWTIGSK